MLRAVLCDLLADLLDLVLPRSCAGCETEGPLLCPACRLVLAGPPLGFVRPTPCPPGLPPVVAALGYEGLASTLLLGHKERGRLHLTRPLGTALAGAARLLVQGPVLLCPVPSSRAAVRARGHDHAWRQTAAVGRELASPAARLLRPTRAVADSAGLSAAARASNLCGALQAQPATCGLPVIVVDDVMTTGATLVEATRALRVAGYRIGGAAVLAATTRRSFSPGQVPPLPDRRDAV